MLRRSRMAPSCGHRMRTSTACRRSSFSRRDASAIGTARRSGDSFSPRITSVVTALLLALLPLSANAVPQADHVQLKCLLQRMNVNDYAIRKQVRVYVTVAASDESRLEQVE